MKSRLLALLCSVLPLVVLAADAPAAAAVPTATTVKRTSVHVGSAAVPLTPGTKLEVLGREGDSLVVKFRSTKGTIALADTDFDPATELPAAPAAEKPVVKPAAATAAKATPPALNTSGQGQQPATNYGKAVQKAKQASEANKSTHVDPTKDIMDDQAKK